MAKGKGVNGAIYMKTSADSASQTGIAMTRVSTTMWWKPTDSSKQWFDKNKAITVYDGVTTITTVQEISPDGYVRLLTVPSGAVTVDAYVFAMEQIVGFNAFSIDENMNLVDGAGFEDGAGEENEATQYSASGSMDGIYTTVDSKWTSSKGSNKDLTFISNIWGTPGDTVAIESIVSGTNTPLSIDISGYPVLVINSATNGSAQATSTARDILAAINALGLASPCRVRLAPGSDGSGVFGAQAHQHLENGRNPAEFDKFNQNLTWVGYWDYSGLIRTVGMVQFEGVSLSLKSLKDLIGKSVRFKVNGMLYDHSG